MGTSHEPAWRFGDHQLEIPYRSVAELFASYRERDPDKTAIVDLDASTRITFGELDQLTTDLAVFLKSHGVRKGSRVLAAVRRKS